MSGMGDYIVVLLPFWLLTIILLVSSTFESRKTFVMCFRAKHYLLHLNFLLVVYAMQVNFIPLFDLVLHVRIQTHLINQYYCQSNIFLRGVPLWLRLGEWVTMVIPSSPFVLQKKKKKNHLLCFIISVITAKAPFLHPFGRNGFLWS